MYYLLFQESFLLPVPSFGPGGNLQRPVSPLVEDTEGEEGEGETGGGGGILKKFNTGVSTPGGLKGAPAQQTPRTTANSILRKCYPSSSPQAPFLPSGHLEDCLPPCYHGAKTMAKLIKVSPCLVSDPIFRLWSLYFQYLLIISVRFVHCTTKLIR